jgi:putative SOS response-associated peptidase YedK
MCGRYAITFSPSDLLEYFNLSVTSAPVDARYNIAPSLEVPAVRFDGQQRALATLRWGLIPSWSKDPSTGFRTINARSETAHSSPAFRAAFKHRRCLLPASGFFEWAKQGKPKQPWYIHRKDGAPLAFAGLWEHWQASDGPQVIESCTILTTAANDLIAPLHERMPVILEPSCFDLWLDPEELRVEKLSPLLLPAKSELLAMYPVSRYVNKVGNEGPECVAPLPKNPEQPALF